MVDVLVHCNGDSVWKLCHKSDQTLDDLRIHVSVLSKQTELFRVMALGHYGTETDTKPFVPESRWKIWREIFGEDDKDYREHS